MSFEEFFFRYGIWFFRLFILSSIVALNLYLIKDTKATIVQPIPRYEQKMITNEELTYTRQLNNYQHVTGVMDIHHWVTPKGIRVFFVQVPTLPMLDIEIIFDAGAARDGKQGGIAYLTNLLLAEGTKQLSNDQIAERFDKVGAQYHANSQRDMAAIHLRSLSDEEPLGKALATLQSVINEPIFPEKGFLREKQHILTILKQQSQRPNDIASRAFFKAIYKDAPYAQWALGTPESIQQITAESIREFYKQYYVANNAVITLVGDLSLIKADNIARKLLDTLPQGQRAPDLPQVTNLTEKTITKIEFDSTQTHIIVGEPGVKQGDPDYYALLVGNHILGGNGSVTRIFETIRNQHGLAYSAYSYFIPMRERGPYMLGCQTRTQEADKALGLLEALLKEFIAKGPTTQELELAKKNLLGGYTLQFDSNLAICRQVAAIGFYGLPLNRFNEFKPHIENLTTAEIQKAFSRHLSGEKLAIVMVGKALNEAKKA